MPMWFIFWKIKRKGPGNNPGFRIYILCITITKGTMWPWVKYNHFLGAITDPPYRAGEGVNLETHHKLALRSLCNADFPRTLSDTDPPLYQGHPWSSSPLPDLKQAKVPFLWRLAFCPNCQRISAYWESCPQNSISDLPFPSQKRRRAGKAFVSSEDNFLTKNFFIF